MSDEELYAQYLKETGQQPSPSPGPRPRTREEIAKEALAPLENTDYGAAMANALSAGGGATLGKAVPALRGVLGSALEGGVLGATQAPEGDRLKNFLAGGAIQGGLGAAGKLLGKAGDVAMQIAVNRKKYTPGVGTKLANEGLWGTQAGMKNQVQSGLADSYEDMLRAAQGAKPVDSRAIGTQVYEDITGPMTGRGRMVPSSADVPRINQAQEFADDIRSRGEEPATQALERRKAAGKRAYSEKTDAGRATPMGELSKKEQILYSNALKQADETGKLAAADERYAALKRAERGLEQEASLPKSVMGVASMSASKIPGGALASSTLGQAGVKGGRLAEFLAPLARQAAVGGQRDPGPSAQELAEYDQYLRETGQK
jgi:hypothetical protein